jgi:hypothetical protein|tara:strand:- start:6185 stop:7147 length:963 start_codon:yes stop_codon:yes gene_type:complete
MDFSEVLKRVRDDEVTTLDAYRRGVGESPMLYRPVVFEAKAHEDDQSVNVFVASTEDEDRGGDVIQQAGWDLANFKSNPVYMWAHNYSIAPIGTVPKVWRDGKTLLNTVKFDMGDDFAAGIARKFDEGILRAQSVGFRPTEFEERDRDGEGKKGMFASFLFTKAELLEISGVPIPMNQAALKKALDAGARPVFYMDSIELPGVAPETTTSSDEWINLNYNVEWTDHTDFLEAKAGRSISKKNLTSLIDAANSIEAAAEAIKSVVDTARTADPEDDEPEPKKSETVEPEIPESITEKETLNADQRGAVSQALLQLRSISNG